MLVFGSVMPLLKIFILGPVLLSGCVEARMENDLKKMNLSGNIKSIRENVKWAKDIGGEIVEIGSSKKIEQGIISLSYEDFDFNEDGNYSKVFTMTSGHELPKETDIYKYSDENILIEILTENDNSNPKKKRLFAYESGHLIEEKAYYFDLFLLLDKKTGMKDSFEKGWEWSYTIAYKFDDQGNKIQELKMGSNESKKSESFFEYNNKSQVVRKTVKDYYGTRVTTFIYNKDGRIITEDIYWTKGERAWSYRHLSEYDQFGSNIKYTTYNNDEIGKIYQDQYKYNDRGNWIENVSFENAEVWSITKRSYTYYE